MQSEIITIENITALRAEALLAGDFAMVRYCERALDGDGEAWGQCAYAIRVARAQCDDESCE